ncbi:VPLPA-CTERM sorting domain-containing protein [Aliishimia ponticola]|nr:VPLPA-CTERM sorting domain-containing protein [Aliishimia ponticola]
MTIFHRTILPLAAAGAMWLATTASAAVIELDVTASWTAADFDVSSTGTSSPSAPPEDNDDLVFGIAPSAGSINFTLLVDTASVVSYPAGGSVAVVHDHFGYSDVSLKDPVTLGSATWETSDILTTLIGPDGAEAALWTDTDLTAGDPTLLSFRMFGEWAGTGGTGTADLFFGSRSVGPSGYQISDSFLAWEYFGGEEIRTTGYSASVAPVPLPAGAALLATGLLGFAATRRRKS